MSVAAIAFTESADGVFVVRKSLYRLMLSRAAAAVRDTADVRELELSRLTEGISLYYLAPEQRRRIAEAMLSGATRLKDDVDAGRSLEEPVSAGISEFLESMIEFLRSHLDDDRLMTADAVPYPYGAGMG